MASDNSIRRSLLRPGCFLKLSGNRLWLVPLILSPGGFSIVFARNGSHRIAPNERKATNPTLSTLEIERWRVC